MKIHLLLVFFLLLSTTLVSGQRFKILNEDHGLSNRRCFSVSQDRNGLIWIATKLSIDRYDGHQLKSYDLKNPDHQEAESIGFNFVTLSPDSSIWAYTQTGSIFRYDERSDAFVFVYSIRTFYQSYNIILNHLMFVDDTTIMLATSKGVLSFDLSRMTASNCSVMQDTETYHILKQQEHYYVSTKNGLYIIRSIESATSKVISHLLKDQFVNRVFYDSKHQQFWIGTFSNGLYILPNREGASLQAAPARIIKPVRSIIPYTDTQLAVGVDGEGILIINRQNLQVENTFIQSESHTGSISGNSIWDLHLDRQNILWVATYHEGVSFTDRSYLNFKSFNHEERNNNSISSNYTNVMLEDRDGDLWFGTNNGISLYFRKTDSWKHFFQGHKLTNRNVILALTETADGTLWAGGYAFGAAKIDKKTGKITRYQSGDAHTVVGTDYIYSVFNDEYTNKLWFGGIYGRISCHDPKTGKTRIYNEDSALRCFASYNDSILVLGLYRGFYLFNTHTGEKSSTRINGTVNTILKDGNRTYWVGTMTNGVYFYDVPNDSLRHFTKENAGLSSNHIYAIEKDEEGFLWISTEEGVNKFSPSSGIVNS
ncbi:MAG: two-component regulator propeller domain-containing protein, partial [Paludibacter sp.]|nr:two-component regulator propeller domain-containing protein [Paludibacter sp.]